MNNPKWGVKRLCLECGARFYDLKKSKIVCPNCDAPFTEEPQPKAKRAIATPAKADKASPPIEDTAETQAQTNESAEDKALKELEVEIPDTESEEDKDKNTFEDVSELGEDEDDMAEVIEGSRKVDGT